MEPITEALNQFLAQVIQFIPKLITSVVVFIIFIILAVLLTRGLRRFLEKRGTDKEIAILLTKVTLWVIIITGVIVSLQQINFDVTAFLAGLGVLGFTVGFAIQDVSKNFIAGLLLLLQQPFEIEDVIQVGEFVGTVKSIDLRATEMRAFDGKTILIPNAEVFTSAIINFGMIPKRRVELTVGVAYDSDLEKVQRVTIDTVKSIPSVSEAESPPQVIFNQFDNSSINCTVYYWIDTEKIGFLDATDQGVRLIKRTFEKEGIEIPYPIQVIQMQK